MNVGIGKAAASLSQRRFEKSSENGMRSDFIFNELSILVIKSDPKLGMKSSSMEKDNAFASEKDGAKPNATAICGRKSSTAGFGQEK